MASPHAGSAESPETKADAKLVSHWRSRNAALCRRIQTAVMNNLELQQLVLSTIEAYENSQKIAKHSGSTVMDLTKKLKKSADAEGPVLSDADKEVGKGRLVYKSWPKKWYQELLCYIEEDLEPAGMNNMPKDRLAEICERVLELQFLGDTPDKASNPKMTKADLFDRLKAVYMANGRSLLEFNNEFSKGYVNWEHFGHYAIRIEESGSSWMEQKVHLTCKAVRKTIVMDPDSMPGDSGPYKLVGNHSLANAMVQGAKDTYRCQNYFTALGRRLKRNLSETLGLAETPHKKAKIGHQQSPGVAQSAPPTPSLTSAASAADVRESPAEVVEEVPPGHQ